MVARLSTGARALSASLCLALAAVVPACGHDELLPDDAALPDMTAAPDRVWIEEPDMARACLQPRTGPEAGEAAGRFARDFLGAVCRREALCGQIALASEIRCVDAAVAYLPFGYSLAEAVTAGRLGFEPTAAAECLARWVAPDCLPGEERWDTAPARLGIPAHATPYAFALDPVSAVRSWCPCVLRPLLANGGSCVNQAECAGGSCAGATCGHRGLCKDAEPPPPVGGACDARPCAAPDYCGADQRCHERAGADRPCEVGLPSCRDGLVCDGGTCVPLGREGDPCGAGCARGFYCDRDLPGQDNWRCRPLLLPGERCSQAGSCTGTTTCDGRCVGWSDLDDPACRCPAELRCSNDKPVCHPAEAYEGGPCRAGDFPCAAHLYCDRATSTCRRRILPGDLCTVDPVGGGGDPCYVGTCERASGRCTVVCGG